MIGWPGGPRPGERFPLLKRGLFPLKAVMELCQADRGLGHGDLSAHGTVLKAFDMALGQRRPLGVIHHSDQGCQTGFKWSSQHIV